MKSHNRFSAFVFLTTCSICFGGKVYNQSSLPRNEVAMLMNVPNSHVSIDVVDGQRKGVPSHGTYEFLPGRHVIRARVSYSKGSMRLESEPVDLTFDAEAASELRIMFKESGMPNALGREEEAHGTVGLWIEDIKTGKIINVVQ